MVIAYNRAGHDTNTPEWYTLAEHRTAGPSSPLTSPCPAATLDSLTATPLSSTAMRNPSGQAAPGDLMCKVALKAIPKQKVQENEESMWGEMRVLQGLHHLNMVSLISPPCLFSMICLCGRLRLSLNMFGCLSVGQILRLVRVWDKI